MSECPHCGQPMVTKFGVKFQPKAAAILEMIEDATKGRGGIEGESLGWVFYPGISKTLQKNRIKVYVCLINDMLAGTDWRVVNERHYKRDGAFYALKEIAA